MPYFVFPLLCFCLLLSGFAGLLYETLWARFLYLYLGHTSHAQAIVLSVFMGGIALGSATLGRWADRLGSKAAPANTYDLLTVYAWIEILIGFYCGLYPEIFTRLGTAYTIIGERWYEEWPGAVTLLKAAFSILTMLIPTFLMGGTIPVLVRLCRPAGTAVGKTAGWLNAANTIGAVAGTLLAGFVLIETIGLSLSMHVGSFANIAVGLLVMGFRRTIVGAVRRTPPPPPEPSSEPDYGTGRQAVALAGIFISGFASFALEVLWARIIGLSLGSSVYAFSIMLATFILGIALGSLAVGAPALRKMDPLRVFMIAEFGIGASLLLLYPLFQDLPFYFAKLRMLLQPGAPSFWLYNGLTFIGLVAVMFVPTVLIGMTFPLAASATARAPESLGRRVGNVLFWNTAGNLSGALVAALLFIPWLGIEPAVEVVIALNLGAGLLLWASAISRFTLPFAAGGAVVLVVVPLGMRAVHWSPMALQSGPYRFRGAPPPLPVNKWREESVRAGQVLYLKDDSNGSVSLVRDLNGEISLKVGAKTDASSYADLPTELLSAHIPMLIKPRTEDVLVVGMGSGITASSVLLYPGTSVHQVEISPAVVEASRGFEQHNRFVHSNPRFHVHVEDAKTYLKLSPGRFDLIISEPSNPWMAGVAGLFSKEFFESARDHLRSGGLMVQWFHLYEMDDPTLSIILNTFGSVFPHVTVWNTLATDLLLIGSNRSIGMDFDHLRAQFDNAAIREDLGRIQVTEPATLLALQALPEEAFRFLVSGDRPVHTDDAPLLDYAAARNFYSGATSTALRNHDARMRSLDRSGLFLARYTQQHPLRESDLTSILQYYLSRGAETGQIASVLMRTMEELSPHPNYAQDRYRIGFYNAINRPEKAMEILRKHLKASPEDWKDRWLVQTFIEMLFKEAENAVSWTQRGSMVEALNQVAAAIPRLATDRLPNWRRLAEIAWRYGEHDAAATYFLRAVQEAGGMKRSNDELLAMASLSLLEAGKTTQAVQLARSALELNARNMTARYVMRRLDEAR
ncbi:MAG: methyltransferase [Nitrospirae bacterium]|nr:methyltransferase [Nitrospirota bacterium]